jgi:hypothetical protein
MTLRIFSSRPAWSRRAAFVVLCLVLAVPSASADQADAKRIFKAMTDYLDAQNVIAFDYDAVLEVVTVDGQKLQIASSGSLTMDRPNQLRATRHGGFADTELTFDGTTLTLFGKNLNLFAQLEIPGSLDNMIDELRLQHGKPLPAADLLLSDAYKAMMHDVTDIKDLGSGVIGGVECDSLAFRTDEVDWQIWISRGDRPYPCRYVIMTRDMTAAPQYSIQVSNWKTGSDVPRTDYSFHNNTNARQVELPQLNIDLPEQFEEGEPK